MHLKKAIHLSWKNLLVNKRRSFLTMLGLIIGIMSVILVMAVGAGAQSLITSQIKKQGTNVIAVLSGASDENGPPATALGIVVTTLTYDDTQALLNKNNVTHITSAAAYISGNDPLVWRQEERSVTYTGTTASYATVEQVTMSNGRFFDEGEEATGTHVVVLGSEIAEEIFGNQNPVGETVKIKRKNFKVIGVMAQKGSAIFDDPDNAVLIPLRAAQQSLLGVKHVSFIRVRVSDEKYLDQTTEEIRFTLQGRHDDEDFSIRNTAQLLDILTGVTNALKFFLVAVAGVSLFVGGVGIMNIMLIAIKEKTREIGLRKAVGARNRDILVQFLLETMTLSVIGGSIGILLGTIIAFIISIIVQTLGYEYEFIISLSSVLVGFFISALIGVIFGTLPARRAAALDPMVALRYE